jgi:hypothetical protein
MPATVHAVPSSAATANAVACAEGRPRLPSHRSDHEIHTPEHRHRQHAHCPDVVGEILEYAFTHVAWSQTVSFSVFCLSETKRYWVVIVAVVV